MERRRARRITAKQALQTLQHLQDDDSGGDTEPEDQISDEVIIEGQAESNSDFEEENESSEEEPEERTSSAGAGTQAILSGKDGTQ